MPYSFGSVDSIRHHSSGACARSPTPSPKCPAGRFSGAMLGSVVYEAGGFSLNGVVATVLGLMATAILWWFVIEHHSSTVGTT